jgi:hypothetical protein
MNRNQRRRNGAKRQRFDRQPPAAMTNEQLYGPNKQTWPNVDEQTLENHKDAHLADMIISIGVPFLEDCAKCLFDKDIRAGVPQLEATRRQWQRAGLLTLVPPIPKEITMSDVNETQGPSNEPEQPESGEQSSADVNAEKESQTTSGEDETGDGEGALASE